MGRTFVDSHRAINFHCETFGSPENEDDRDRFIPEAVAAKTKT